MTVVVVVMFDEFRFKNRSKRRQTVLEMNEIKQTTTFWVQQKIFF